MTFAKWAGIVIGILLIIYFIFRTIMFFVGLSSNKEADVLFGKLTPISFPNGVKNNFTYSIDTISGALPFLPSQTKIYKMSKGEPDILAVERTSGKVASLGFKDRPEQLSDVLYAWRSDLPFSRILTVSVNSSQFSLNSSFTSNEAILSARNLPTKEKAIDEARSFISALSFLPDDIDDSATKIKLLRIQNGNVTEASSISNAQLLSVYFFQKKDEVPFAYPVGGLSTMNLTLGSGGFDPVVVDARFFYQKVLEEGATYPLITANQAFEKLKKGNAYISSYDGKDTNVFIKKIYLAYYIEGKEQDYLEPVVVFEGNNNFFAYVPALKDEWVSN